MLIGRHAIVEFGETGNACFVFNRSNLPFQLSGEIAGDRSALKHEEHELRLLHFDRAEGSWEATFEQELARVLRVRPAAPYGDGTTVPSGVRGRLGEQRRDQGGAAMALPSLDQVGRWCAAREWRFENKTGIGGNFWVLLDNTDAHAAAQLKEWGFTYAGERKRWWRR